MRKAAFCAILLVLEIFLAGALPAAAAPRYTCLDLGAQGIFTSTYAYGIGPAGQAVGYAVTNEGNCAWLYSAGVMQVLGTLPSPYNVYSTAYSVNAVGQVVGDSDKASGVSHAFLYSGGSMQDLGTFAGGTISFAYGINASGQVVGCSNGPDASFRAFLYSNGVMHDLGTLPGTSSSKAYGINDAGQVVGQSGWNAFLYSGGAKLDLGSGEARAINAAGQVVGSSTFSTPTYYSHAFLYSNDGMQDLGTLPAPYNISSYAYGINAAGQVVGSSISASSQKHPFLFSAGAMSDLNSLVPNLPVGVVLAEARGINDRGQIIVNGYDYNSAWLNHAYLLTPVSSLPGLDLLLLD